MYTILQLFCVGEAGEFDAAEQREREIVRQKLKARGVSFFITVVEGGRETCLCTCSYAHMKCAVY